MILRKIVENTRAELELRKKNMPLAVLKKMMQTRTRPINLAEALKGEDIRLIAEVKKASPSRGVIRIDFNPVEIAQMYSKNGASAISVLTDSKYFQGSLDDLSLINTALGSNRPPLLRKDFILDPFQIYESRAYGADSLLLIAALLTTKDLKELLELAHSLDMQCLVETHNEEDVNESVACGAQIIGINNRDLNTFKVDLDTTTRLRPLIPNDRIVVSESGIKTRQDINKLRSLQVNAALVGETLMASQDIPAAIKELL